MYFKRPCDLVSFKANIAKIKTILLELPANSIVSSRINIFESCVLDFCLGYGFTKHQISCLPASKIKANSAQDNNNVLAFHVNGHRFKAKCGNENKKWSCHNHPLIKLICLPTLHNQHLTDLKECSTKMKIWSKSFLVYFWEGPYYQRKYRNWYG